MRQFIVIGHDVPTDPDAVSLADLPGAGRLDVLCRCLNSAFFLSHDLRDNVRVWLVVGDEYAIRFEGSELRRLNPDERSTAALVRGALAARERAIGSMAANPSPGVYIRTQSLSELLESVTDDGPLVTLHEDGQPVVDIDPSAEPTFVLSDHHSFDDAETALLAAHADRRVSLGPEPLHADHAITVAHNYLDTDGYNRY